MKGSKMRWNRREFAQSLLSSGAIFAVPPSLLAEVPSSNSAHGEHREATKDPYQLVDYELIEVLKGIPPLVLSPEKLTEIRKAKFLPPLPAPMPQPVSRWIPGATGSPDVHIFIVDPSPGRKNRPVFLHTHGGGYVTPNPRLYPFIQTTASDCECVVVSVDYRLSPETRFPGSLDDNYAALSWIYQNATSLGIDRERIAIGGESAGGGHAAALALRARDRAEIPLLFQVLIYPELDDRTGSSHPISPSMGQFIWTAQCNHFGWTSLLGIPAGSSNVPYGSVPARVEDLKGLPPAWIGVGSIDLFADEDIIYAKRMMDAGIPTELVVFPGCYHAFDALVPDATSSKTFTESWKSALRCAYGIAH
jgi:acetyl esterase/lipase